MSNFLLESDEGGDAHPIRWGVVSWLIDQGRLGQSNLRLLYLAKWFG